MSPVPNTSLSPTSLSLSPGRAVGCPGRAIPATRGRCCSASGTSSFKPAECAVSSLLCLRGKRKTHAASHHPGWSSSWHDTARHYAELHAR